MRLPQALSLFILLTLTTTSHARRKLGINCRGSSQCSKLFMNAPFGNVINAFDEIIHNGSISNLPGGPLNSALRVYAGENIACVENAVYAAGSICMFLQGNVPETGIDGYTIAQRISDLNYHGCTVCGSVPTSGDNNPDAMGILTVNYVTSKGCNGLCDGIYQAGSDAR